METIIQDLRYALRTLIKNPGFATIAILTLAIGIGANTAIFTVVQAALLRSLPYKDVDRLVYVSERNPRDGNRIRQASYPDYLDWQKASALAGIAGYGGMGFFLGTNAPENIVGGRVTHDFFKVLGVEPILGRHFTSADENGDGRVAIVTNGFWQRRLGADRNAVGTRITLSGSTYEVIGVLPDGFHFSPVGPAELYVPMIPTPQLRERRFTHWIFVIARLKDAVTIEGAQPELTAIGARIAELDQQFHKDSTIRLGPLTEPILGSVRPVLLGLFAAVGFVLLIACANVANLVLARSAGREREIAIRVAVGANRRRLTQQLLTETVLISVLGGALGILFAAYGVDFLLSRIPQNLISAMPYLADVGLNYAVLVFTAAAAILTGVACGLLPAIQASATNIRQAMMPMRRRLRNVLVTAEVALAFVLLVAAGLLMKSMVRLLEVDPGFRAANLLTMRVTLLGDLYREPIQLCSRESRWCWRRSVFTV